MQSERNTSVAMTPDEERELRFPVVEEQLHSRNFTPFQIIMLFIQFCLVGIFLGAIISHDSTKKDIAIPQKMFVVTVEREKNAGGGFKYRIVSGRKGELEALIMENLPSAQQLATTEDPEVNEPTTAIRSMFNSNQPQMTTTSQKKTSVPPRLTIINEISMPSPPVPPPWLPRSSAGPLLSEGNPKQQRPIVKSTTRASSKYTYGRYDFYRG